MPTSAPGSNSFPLMQRRAPARAGGFTLIEVLIVLVIIALASSLVALALRDPASTQLEREASRLAALLEAERSEARSAGLAVLWVPGQNNRDGTDFQFVGLPTGQTPPAQHWLDPDVQAEVVGARTVTLGPEPIIGAQRILLHLRDQRLALVTDGLGPFKVESMEASPP
ncbi:MAG TPA: prepilin-type N-terminal cleavage/methylation domain-containing protein [Methylibium sp.]